MELEPTFVLLTNIIVEIKHELALTNIVGKVGNTLTENRFAQVYILKAFLKDINNIVQI